MGSGFGLDVLTNIKCPSSAGNQITTVTYLQHRLSYTGFQHALCASECCRSPVKIVVKFDLFYSGHLTSQEVQGILCQSKGSTRLVRYQKWIRGLGLYYCITRAVTLSRSVLHWYCRGNLDRPTVLTRLTSLWQVWKKIWWRENETGLLVTFLNWDGSRSK